MSQTLKSASLNSQSTFSATRSSARVSQRLESGLSKTTHFGTRSRLEIGRFDRVFTSSGSVRRNFDDVFRFDLNSRRRLRIYLGNEFSNPRSNNRRMVVDLLNDRNLRRVSSVTVNPTTIDAITTTLSAGTYRIRISTQSNDRGRYFLDMVRL
jgi:hypothetical protein